MSIPDRNVPETLELIAKLLASVSERVDNQTEALNELTDALGELATAEAGALERIVATQERTQVAADPDRVARATAHSVSQALVPELHKIVDTMDELTGGKALLRERWRAFDREEARQGRWRFEPWAVSLGIPLALGLLLAAFMPSAVAQTPLTCRGAGGWWWVATERYPAVCVFEAHGRLHQATGQVGEADAGSS